MKTTDEELNRWRYDNKRAPVSLRISGDEALAMSYMGEAKVLLWSVKNAMRLNKQPVGWGERRPGDGTVISVDCIFGLDVVSIDTRLSVGVGQASCKITFISLPASVPPMRNLVADMNIGTIDPGDVEGVDYFKTYFSVTTKNCPTCQRIRMSMTYTYATPPEPLHYHNDGSIPYSNDGITTVPPGGDDPNDHLVYSISPPAKGEIIGHGTDAGGSYFIWKAYTETPLEGLAYSRTGLGILLINAVILDGKGNTVCSQQQKVRVDCCLKNPDLRPVEIWWEDFCTCQPFIMYPSPICRALCKMPTTLPMGGTAGLIWYACTFPQQAFYAIPEIKGSCLPLEWTLTGPITLWNSKKNDNAIYISCQSAGCFAAASITLKDRCGLSYTVNFTPCCSDCAPLEINYTSLQMSCGGQQQFNGMGGCGPYVWSCGNGTIDQGGNYTAPSSNGGCPNDTVTVTDCCGNTANCTIAINCDGSAGPAVETCEEVVCDPGPPRIGYYIVATYNCDGSQYSYGCAFYYGGFEYHFCDCGDCCGHYLPDNGCATILGPSGGDLRTPAMIAAGCCPIQLA